MAQQKAEEVRFVIEKTKKQTRQCQQNSINNPVKKKKGNFIQAKLRIIT